MNFEPEYSLSILGGEQFWILFSEGEKNILICSETASPLHWGACPVTSVHPVFYDRTERWFSGQLR